MVEPNRFSHEDYRLAWICALPLELAAAKTIFDETHASLPSVSAHVSYSLGRIAGHNIVMACLPTGVYGTTSATAIVSHACKTCLARISWDMGHLDHAEGLRVEVIEATKRMLGDEHPVTLDNRDCLAKTYVYQECWNEAEKTQVSVFEARKRILGEEQAPRYSTMSKQPCSDIPRPDAIS
jgi:hypothetical protein